MPRRTAALCYIGLSMTKKAILTTPDQESTSWPKGIPYIIGNEACERFSFYGMKAILQPHLTMLYAATAVGAERAAQAASADVHMFIASAYALPMIGAIIADKWLGKYLTIMTLSLVYCLGHLVLAFAENSIGGMHAGLALIALGTGGIKPCVSAHVGDQFGRNNWGLSKKAFQIFYFSINFGSFFSTLLIPWLRVTYGPTVAFGLPGVLMFLATFVFWSGRWSFVHVPPKPGGKLGLLDAVSGIFLFIGFLGAWLFGPEFGLSMAQRLLVAVPSAAVGFALFFWRQTLQRDDGFLASLLLPRKAAPVVSTEPGGELHRQTDVPQVRAPDDGMEAVKSVFRVLSVILPVSLFWALFDQHSTTWVTQAGMMDREILGFTLLPEQTHSANPIIVMLLIPLMVLVVFPFFERRGIRVTPLRRMSVGMALAAFAFVATALVQAQLDAGEKLSILWQLPQYVIMTLSEVLVSTTGLEFSYSQAPRRLKSTVMSLWNLQVTFGNVIAAVLIGQSAMNASLFWTFAGAMGGFGALFILRAAFYKYRDYTQE
jgi:POT family proton-dependent oligopeptide transporter